MRRGNIKRVDKENEEELRDERRKGGGGRKRGEGNIDQWRDDHHFYMYGTTRCFRTYEYTSYAKGREVKEENTE